MEKYLKRWFWSGMDLEKCYKALFNGSVTTSIPFETNKLDDTLQSTAS